jgi:hypothetical protein
MLLNLEERNVHSRGWCWIHRRVAKAHYALGDSKDYFCYFRSYSRFSAFRLRFVWSPSRSCRACSLNTCLSSEQCNVLSSLPRCVEYCCHYHQFGSYHRCQHKRSDFPMFWNDHGWSSSNGGLVYGRPESCGCDSLKLCCDHISYDFIKAKSHGRFLFLDSGLSTSPFQRYVF